MRRSWLWIAPVFAVLGVVAAPSVIAGATDWSVSQMSGKVTISVAGARPVSLTKGEVLPAGGILTTGPSSRALLVRDQQTMVVGPNAAVAIPTGSTNPQYTTVLENAGVVEYTVDKQNVQHFAVETPYLAAVVKGTQFSVDVEPSGGTVSVTRGIVEVTSLATGYVVDIVAGQSIAVSRDGTMTYAGPGAVPQASQGVARAPLVGLGVNGFGNLSQSGLGVTVGSSLGIGASANVGSGGINASVDAGPASIQANAGSDGINASVDAGPASIQASAGSDGINAGASAGGVDASASVGGGGVSVDASVGGIDAGASVGGGGVSVDVGGISIGLGR